MRLYLKTLNSKPNPNSVQNNTKSPLLQVEEGMWFRKLKIINKMVIQATYC